MQYADVVIVGAGFAGLACAESAASRGLRSIVLERKPDAGARSHTTGIVVQEAAVAWNLPRRFVREIPGVRLYAPSHRFIDLERPGYRFFATDTPELLRWFARDAEVRTSTPFRGAVRRRDFIEIPEAGLRCRFLVGADGARSRVAAAFGLDSPSRFLVGVEHEYEGLGGIDPNRLHCFLDNRLAPGYLAWAVPGVGITQIGLARLAPGRPNLAAFEDRLRRLFDFSGARVVGKRAGVIPIDGPVRRSATGNVILIGDAAGLVSPLTAGGIHTALDSGRQAGHAIADHLKEGAEHPARVLRRPKFLWKRILRAAYGRGIPDRILERVLRQAPLRALAQTVFFHSRGLLSPTAWRDLVACFASA